MVWTFSLNILIKVKIEKFAGIRSWGWFSVVTTWYGGNLWGSWTQMHLQTHKRAMKWLIPLSWQQHLLLTDLSASFPTPTPPKIQIPSLWYLDSVCVHVLWCVCVCVCVCFWLQGYRIRGIMFSFKSWWLMLIWCPFNPWHFYNLQLLSFPLNLLMPFWTTIFNTCG